jgi:exopolysaccharide biosynthesis protein
LKNGIDYSTENNEYFNDNIMTPRHPRSAICRKSNGNIIFMAIDGR